VLIAAGGSFVHGFTFSHSAAGAAVARVVLRRLRDEGLVEASREKGELLRKLLASELAGHPFVGDIRGLGLMFGVELVADRTKKTPFSRIRSVAERAVAAAKDRGVVLYSSVGCADGTNGDLLMLGPPFTISQEDLALAAGVVREAIDEATR